MSSTRSFKRPLLTGAVLALLVAPAAVADPLENMERERARLIAALLDPDRDVHSRLAEANTIRRRLVDLERIALRDPRIESDARPIARRAFADYDLTFLAHASIERDMAVLDLWLDRLGVSTGRVMAARVGRR